MHNYRVLDTDGEYLTEVESDCIQNADYTAQAMGYEVLDYLDDFTLVARPATPLPMSQAQLIAWNENANRED